MKKLLLIAASIATVSLSSFGQGTFYMVWYDGVHGITIGPAGNPGTVGWFLGSEYSAEAYMGPVGSYEGALSPIAASLTVFDLTGATAAGKSPADGAGQFYNPNPMVTSLPLGNAAIQIRAWYNAGLYSTYEVAMAAGVNTGRSTVMTISLKAGADPTIQNLTDIGMLPFMAGVLGPEPSTIALAGLGAATLLLFRRRK